MPMCYTDFKKYLTYPYVLQNFSKMKSYRYTSCPPTLILLSLFLKLGFSTLAPLTSGVRYLFLMEDFPEHCKMFSSNSGPCPLDRCSSMPFPTVTTKIVPTYCQMFLRGKITPFENLCFRDIHYPAVGMFSTCKSLYVSVSQQNKYCCLFNVFIVYSCT